jgi:hypothetical protein
VTPRAFWDRQGWLYEEKPGDPTQIRFVWSPGSAEVRPAPMYGPRWVVEDPYGPLIPAA